MLGETLPLAEEDGHFVAFRQGVGVPEPHTVTETDAEALKLGLREAAEDALPLLEVEDERDEMLDLVGMEEAVSVRETLAVGEKNPERVRVTLEDGDSVPLTAVLEKVGLLLGVRLGLPEEEGQPLLVTSWLVGIAEREELPVGVELALVAPLAVPLELFDSAGEEVGESVPVRETLEQALVEGEPVLIAEKEALAVMDGLPLADRLGHPDCEAVAERGGTVCVCVARPETEERGDALSVAELLGVLVLLPEAVPVGEASTDLVPTSPVALGVAVPAPVSEDVRVTPEVPLPGPLLLTVLVTHRVGVALPESVTRLLMLSVAVAESVGREAEAEMVAVGVPEKEGSLLALLVEEAVSLKPALRVPEGVPEGVLVPGLLPVEDTVDVPVKLEEGDPVALEELVSLAVKDVLPLVVAVAEALGLRLGDAVPDRERRAEGETEGLAVLVAVVQGLRELEGDTVPQAVAEGLFVLV